MTTLAASVVMLLLHGPDGRAVSVNSAQIVSLHASKPGTPNKVVVDGVNCLINTTDGKYVSVRETCAEVQRMIGGTR